MARKIVTVVLTAAQFAAYNYLVSVKRNDDVVRDSWVEGIKGDEKYVGVKLNTFNALLAKGVVVTHKQTPHFRMQKNIEVVQAAEKPAKVPAAIAAKNSKQEVLQAA